MPNQDPHRLYVHLAWSTLAQVPALEPGRRAAIETHLLASCRWFGTDPIEVCALPDRVHLLVRLPAVLSVQELAIRVRSDVERMLAESGRVVRWAPGYAAMSVAPGEVRRIRKRIASLEWHKDPPRHPKRPSRPNQNRNSSRSRPGL